jgi:hypothetical protein
MRGDPSQSVIVTQGFVFLKMYCPKSLKQKKLLTQGSNKAVIYSILAIKKYASIFLISGTKSKNIVVFAFTYVSETFALLYGDCSMNSHSVDNGEAMRRRSNEVLRW